MTGPLGAWHADAGGFLMRRLWLCALLGACTGPCRPLPLPEEPEGGLPTDLGMAPSVSLDQQAAPDAAPPLDLRAAPDLARPIDLAPPPDLATTSATLKLSLFAGQLGGAGNADGVGAAARLFGPHGVALDGAGHLFVADTL